MFLLTVASGWAAARDGGATFAESEEEKRGLPVEGGQTGGHS
jgi:hypothetical protein